MNITLLGTAQCMDFFHSLHGFISLEEDSREETLRGLLQFWNGYRFRSYATTNRWWYRTWDDLSILSIPNQSVANRDLQTNKERSTNKGLSTFPLSIPQQCSVSLSEQLGDITSQHEFEQCLIYRIPSFHNYLWGSEGLYPCWKHICRLGLHLNKLTWFPIPLVGWEPLGPSPSWFTECWFECRLECWLECSMGT